MKEPLRIGAMESGMVCIDDADGKEIAGWFEPDDARRIIACVNACEGIPTPQLECDSAAFILLLNSRNSLEQQRDELLAALEKAKFAMEMRNWDWKSTASDDLQRDAYSSVKATITKIKGEQA